MNRLRHTPTVELAPCTPRGLPTGGAVLAEARLLDGAEALSAAQRLRRRHPIVHGLAVPIELRLKRTRGLYYEVTTLPVADHNSTG